MDSNHPQPRPDLPESWVERLFHNVRGYTVLLMDAQGLITAWPESARVTFGYEAAEVLGRPLDLFFAPEDQAVHVPSDELATAAAVGHAPDDRWHVRKDGSRFWATGATVAIRDESGALLGFGKIMQDRTDLRTQVETLKHRLSAERQAGERKDVFLATLAHELRSPLAALSNAAQLIRLTPAHTDAKYALQLIERQIGFIGRMVDDLMDLARVNTGKLQLDFKQVVLQDALSEALASVEPAARARRQQLESVLPEQPLHVEVDPDRFHQIIVNLLGNAIKFTPEGGRVWLKAIGETGHAAVRIEDSGIGISPDMQPRLFELFTQGDVSKGKRMSGLGIGLALVKELVEMHSGSIAVRSEGAGQGSEFTVRLPLRQPRLAGDSAPG
jgi:PAS domain S-box-containing protein